MQQYEFELALAAARCQIPHIIHTNLFEKTFPIAKKLIIGLGSANIRDRENPFTFQQRKDMLLKIAEMHNWGDKLAKIVPLDDFGDDEKWFQHCRDQAGDFDLFVGNDRRTLDIFVKRGIAVFQPGIVQRNFFESTKLRQFLEKGSDKWRLYVDVAIQPMVELCYRQFKEEMRGSLFDPNVTVLNRYYRK